MAASSGVIGALSALSESGVSGFRGQASCPGTHERTVRLPTKLCATASQKQCLPACLGTARTERRHTLHTVDVLSRSYATSVGVSRRTSPAACRSRGRAQLPSDRIESGCAVPFTPREFLFGRPRPRPGRRWLPWLRRQPRVGCSERGDACAERCVRRPARSAGPERPGGVVARTTTRNPLFSRVFAILRPNIINIIGRCRRPKTSPKAPQGCRPSNALLRRRGNRSHHAAQRFRSLDNCRRISR